MRVPSCYVMINDIKADPRFSLQYKSIPDRFPVNSLAICTLENMYGALGKVTGHSIDKKKDRRNKKESDTKEKADKPTPEPKENEPKPGKPKIQFQVKDMAVLPPFLTSFAAENVEYVRMKLFQSLLISRDVYHNMNQVARLLGISNRTLSKITASVKVQPGNLNFGLNIKFSGKNQQVT